MAAGETILVLDSHGDVARRAALTMLAGLVASAVLMTLNKDSHVFGLFASTLVFGTMAMKTVGFGIEWSLLAVGSGMLIGMRILLSMLLGAVLSWVIAPHVLPAVGFRPEKFVKFDILLWVMWPATGMMVAGGLTALVLRWKILARAFRNLSSPSTAGDEFPLGWVIAGVLICGVALVVVQQEMLGQPVWITAVAIVLSLPLALVGLRVLGETNWGPISALSNMMQGVFALLAPGSVSANMVASGTTGTIAANSEAIMQDYKAGDMVGSSPGQLTCMQLLATPVGAAAVSWMYPVLREQYGIGDKGLSSPISQKWVGFAEILSRGIKALPEGALEAMVVATLLGVLLAVLEIKVKDKRWVPSPTGMGIGMLIPSGSVVMMVVGGLIALAWSKKHPRTSALYMVPLASGLIAGEALVAVVVALLAALGLLSV
jgi:uncharacterized oligopeptide transporter (OPT) family protein